MSQKEQLTEDFTQFKNYVVIFITIKLLGSTK